MALYDFGGKSLSSRASKVREKTVPVSKKNPEANTPVKEPVKDHLTATVYSEKQSDGSKIPQVFSIDGIKWTGVYYNQILGKDDAPRQLDLGLDPTLQQYIRVNEMPIYLQGDGWSFSRDGASGIGVLEAEGQIYPGLTPQPGDMIVGVNDEGRKAIFIVSQPTPMNHRTLTAHSFTVKLWNYAEDKYLNNLDVKTVKVYGFDESAAYCGEGLVEEAEIAANKDANVYIKELVNMYYDFFFDKQTMTFLYPSENSRIYDIATTEFFVRLINREYLQQHKQAMLYNVESKEYRDTITTMWDVMMTGTKLWQGRIMESYEIRSTEEYVSPYMFSHVSHSHLDSVLAPAKLSSVISDGNPEEIEDAYYVFSEGFYKKDFNGTTLLESYVLAALEGVNPSMSNIKKLIDEMMVKTKVKQFHEIPIILWLLVKIVGIS